MKIHIPNSAYIGNIDPFLKSIDTSSPTELEITSNENWISFHPVVLSIIAALGLSTKPTKISSHMTAKSAHYPERMGLFKLLDIKSSKTITEHEPAGRFIPLTIIKDSKKLTDFIADISPLLHPEPRQAEAIRYVVSELVRNVLEHAQSSIGAVVCAQYYKKSNTIRIGIVDAGVGIKQTINKSHPANSHLEAIRLALVPGITGTTQREGGTDFNAGAGLFFIKSTAKVNKDFFMIYSGHSMYKLLKTGPRQLYADPFRDNHSKREDLPFWQGTVVAVDISLDQTEELSSLLGLIGDVYSKTARERRKARYRKPTFI